MFSWIQRQLARLNPATRGELVAAIDTLNDLQGGGPGTPHYAEPGSLAIPSGRLCLRDPQGWAPCVTDWARPVDLGITLNVRVRPDGSVHIEELILRVKGESPAPDDWRELGQIGIDSAKVVVADEEAHNGHWTETGPDRIGHIRVLTGDRCLKLLQRKFRFKIAAGNRHSVRIAGPISTDLEKEVMAYLETIPEFADYPFLHFWVHTNNSFERVNNFDKAWGFLPVGNSSTPEMFVCTTGHGDGCYNVSGGYAGSQLVEVRVPFVVDE